MSHPSMEVVAREMDVSQGWELRKGCDCLVEPFRVVVFKDHIPSGQRYTTELGRRTLQVQ